MFYVLYAIKYYVIYYIVYSIIYIYIYIYILGNSIGNSKCYWLGGWGRLLGALAPSDWARSENIQNNFSIIHEKTFKLNLQAVLQTS
jgi:hypothetical protein